ncbi:MAG: hypothetical protein HGA66_07990 [Holophaga sp.]|nr:hypothetical protein [Holophaga sp.]
MKLEILQSTIARLDSDRLSPDFWTRGPEWGAELWRLSRVLKAKRKAQRANSLVFSSLNRMAGDPDVMREGIERNAALANHNLRITRWLSVATVHFQPGGPPIPGLEPLARAAGEALEAIADVAEGADPAVLAGPREALEAAELPGLAEPRTAYVTSQLDLAGTELSAMLIEFHELSI